MAVDPVCGGFVPEGTDALTAEIRGHTYHFCSDRCRRRFTAPDREVRRLWRMAALALGLGAVLAAMTHLQLGLFEAPMHGWVLLGLGTVVQAVAGYPFYRAIVDAARQGAANVDLLVALGTTAAWLFGVVEVLVPELLVAGALTTYFEVSALVLGFLLVARAAEHRFRRDTGEEARELMELQPTRVRIVEEDDTTREEAVEGVEAGDRFVVEPGDRVPLDGVVREGESAVDEKMVTGEGVPVDKRPGDKVLGGTVNQEARLLVEATHTGSDSTVAKIVNLMADAREATPPIQRFVDSVTAWYVPAVVLVAALSFLAWWTIGAMTLPFAFSVLIAVLLVGCPSPLGLSTPAAVEAGIARGAEQGLLLKGGEFMEVLQQVDMVVFDKTGTLTVGKPVLTDVHTLDGDEDRMLRLAATVEQRSDHPLARATMASAAERDVEVGEVEGFEAIGGAGVTGTVDGEEVHVGSTNLMEQAGIDVEEVGPRVGELQDQGKTVILVAHAGEIVGVLAFEDALKEEAFDAVEALQAKGIDVALMTGDHVRTAQAVGAELGLGKRRAFAELTPDDKVALVKSLQGGDRVVAMVGDGINDAPALAAADVGIAIGKGSDVVVEAGDIVLLRNRLEDVVAAIELGDETLDKIKQNLTWAFAYNVVLIPLAAGLLVPIVGFRIGPILAGALMASSTFPVLANSARARRAPRATPAGS